MIKHLTLLKTQDMIDIKEVFFQWFTIFLIKSLFCLQINLPQAVVLHKPVVRKFKKKTKFNHLLKLVSDIFYKICISHQMTVLQKR